MRAGILRRSLNLILVLARGRKSALTKLRMLIIAEDIKQFRYILNIKESHMPDANEAKEKELNETNGGGGPGIQKKFNTCTL